MTGRYKAYLKYKESGINWLESIPVHWGAKPLKHQSSCNDEVINEKVAPDYEIEYVDIGSVSAIDGISKTEKMAFENAPSRARRKVQDGDVIVSTVRTYLEAVAPIIEPPENMLVSTGFAVIRPNSNFDKGFASYCLRARGFIEEVVARSVGVSYPAINSTDLINITIPCAPINEQQKIASFLDHETAKIDTLIAKQEKLIELLKEKRQAVISHAVTKGLNPNAPMRDSGVEWLGEVPEHWDVAPIKFISTYNDDSLSDITDEDYQIEYIDIGSVSAVNGVEKTEMLTFGNAPSRARRKLQAGDVIVSTVRTYLEAIAVIDSEKNNLVASTGFCVIRPTKIKEHFAGFALRTRFFIAEVIARSTGISYPAINSSDLVNIKIAYPSEQEQEDINQFVKNQCLIFDSLTEKATNAISLLKERKTALISAAVTGKIDVRDWKF